MTVRSQDPFMFFVAFVSFVVYVTFLVMLVRFRKQEPFNGSYFKICLSVGCSDVLALIQQHFAFKFRTWRLFGIDQFFINYISDTLLSRCLFAMTFYFGIVQAVGVLLLSFNRFTALALPYYHQQVWSRSLVPLILLKWLAPALIVAPWLNIPVLYFRNNATGDAQLFVARNDYVQNYFMLSTGIIMTVTFSVAFLYSIAFYRLRENRRKTAPANTVNAVNPKPVETIDKFEVKLALSGLCIFLVLCIYEIFLILSTLWSLTVKDQTAVNIFMPLWYIAADAFSYGAIHGFCSDQAENILMASSLNSGARILSMGAGAHSRSSIWETYLHLNLYLSNCLLGDETTTNSSISVQYPSQTKKLHGTERH